MEGCNGTELNSIILKFGLTRTQWKLLARMGYRVQSFTSYTRAMRDNRERWMELAELAAAEQDPHKLSELVREIDRLLAEKMDRLTHERIPSKPSE
jgi:hypothetical protein